MVEAQEQERTRIARELHDDISQRLALLAVELGQVQEDRCWTTVASWQAFELTQSSTALPYLTLTLSSQYSKNESRMGGTQSDCGC
jgi:nitrate/nitrite-specific signal transduction histidine kinase